MADEAVTKRTIKRDDGEFVVTLVEGWKSATVTDDKGYTVTIRYERGARPFNVRTPSGWGQWEPTMEGAVNSAVKLCLEARTFLGPDEFSQRLADYVKGEEQEH